MPASTNGTKSVQPRFDSKKADETSAWLWTFWERYADESVVPEWGNPGRVDALRRFAQAEPILIGALSSMTSKAISLDWQITGGRNKVSRYQEILAEADNGAGWSFFLDRWLQDYLQADQGGLVELGRQGKRGPVLGLYNLDAATCQLTANPATPVAYYPRMAGGAVGGRRIPLEPTDFSRIVDLPSPDESKGGLGFCATSRALKIAQVLMALYRYEEERLSDMPIPGIATVTGMTQAEVKAAFDLYNAKRAAKEQVTFKGVLWLAAQSSPINPIDVKLTPFANLPDGFNKTETINLYVYTLALDFGVDVREFWPASQTGATKAEAEVQAQKAKGKGFGRMLSSIERAIAWDVLPEGLEFKFDQKDSEDDLLRETVREKVIANIGALAGGQIITPDEARRWLVELEMAPDWLAETQLATMHSTPNVEDTEPDVVEQPDLQPAPAQAQAPAPAQAQAEKARLSQIARQIPRLAESASTLASMRVAEKAARAGLAPGEDFVAVNAAGQVVTLWSSRRVFSFGEKGGPGSGNFDHEGRPGKVGGSAPGDEAGGSAAGKPAKKPERWSHLSSDKPVIRRKFRKPQIAADATDEKIITTLAKAVPSQVTKIYDMAPPAFSKYGWFTPDGFAITANESGIAEYIQHNEWAGSDSAVQMLFGRGFARFVHNVKTRRGEKSSELSIEFRGTLKSSVKDELRDWLLAHPDADVSYEDGRGGGDRRKLERLVGAVDKSVGVDPDALIAALRQATAALLEADESEKARRKVGEAVNAAFMAGIRAHLFGEKGGPGSGHFDHEGRPGVVNDLAAFRRRIDETRQREKAASPAAAGDDPLDEERLAAEAILAAAMYGYFARQWRALRRQLTAQRKALLAAQAGTPGLGIVIGLDWGAEEGRLLASLGPVLEDVISDAGRLAWGELQSLGVELSWEVYDRAAQAWAERYGYDLVTQITRSTREQLGKLISKWIASDEDFQELTERVRKLVPDNPYPFIRDRARLIAQTETTRVYAESRMAGLAAAGLKQMTWQTARDELVCPICRPLHGQAGNIESGIFNPDDGQYYKPPAHVGCRCWLVASTAEMDARVAVKGGPGSGNFGHAGRPGKVGGSAPSVWDEQESDFTNGKVILTGDVDKIMDFVSYQWDEQDKQALRALFSMPGYRCTVVATTINPPFGVGVKALYYEYGETEPTGQWLIDLTRDPSTLEVIYENAGGSWVGGDTTELDTLSARLDAFAQEYGWKSSESQRAIEQAAAAAIAGRDENWRELVPEWGRDVQNTYSDREARLAAFARVSERYADNAHEARRGIKAAGQEALMQEAELSAWDANQVMDAWSTTANDDGGWQDRLHLEAFERMGQPDGIQTTKGMEVAKYSDRGENRQVYDSIYQRSQAYMAAHGVGPDDEIVIYRGSLMRPGEHFQPGDLIQREPRPLSSFALDINTAYSFGGAPDNGVIYAVKVPAKAVFAHWSTGFGCYDENEVVVLGEYLKDRPWTVVNVGKGRPRADWEKQKAAAKPKPPAAVVYAEDDESDDWLITLQKRRKAQDGTPTDADLTAALREEQD